MGRSSTSWGLWGRGRVLGDQLLKKQPNSIPCTEQLFHLPGLSHTWSTPPGSQLIPEKSEGRPGSPGHSLRGGGGPGAPH